ncbi:MT-A70 family protein [Oxytricha trifallax]|uniref:mRNA m(6)A methyltransferase n=1 Tax=Oxytricha trifallax TaxID=1172189 RepID=A0A073HYI1_9SPIT|nr:MT-A70 family protein [Oxytricha trifallax]
MSAISDSATDNLYMYTRKVVKKSQKRGSLKSSDFQQITTQNQLPWLKNLLQLNAMLEYKKFGKNFIRISSLDLEHYLEQQLWTNPGNSTAQICHMTAFQISKQKRYQCILSKKKAICLCGSRMVNQKLQFRFQKKHGYRWVETIVWVKTNKSGKIYRVPGRYIQHGFELCLVCVKGSYEKNKSFSKMKTSLNVIVEPMRKMSQKPDALYKIVEKLVPGGPYLEIFGRAHNIRRGWTTMGNQL